MFVNVSWAKVVHIRVTEAMDVGIKLVVLPFNNSIKSSKNLKIFNISNFLKNLKY